MNDPLVTPSTDDQRVVLTSNQKSAGSLLPANDVVATEEVLVLDFGGQYSQLIARRIRECGVFAELLPANADVEKIRARAPKALVLHPGPMIRGLEIAGEVADGPQSAIEEQVAHGLAIRSALLVRALGESGTA